MIMVNDPWQEALREAEENDRIDREIAANVARLSAKWRTAWPSACAKCGGWGQHVYRQGHPYGSTTAYECVADPCEALPDGACHRCGGVDSCRDGEPCTLCGWNCDDGDPAVNA